MAYAAKYKIEYKRVSNNTTTIIIYQDGYTGSTITELVPDENPLEISFEGNVNDIFESTKGSGANINVLATPLSLMELFTTNPQEYAVKVFNGTTGGTITWQGYLNTGVYSEDYSVGAGLLTPITITANDGMAVLDKISYKVSETGAYYTGFSTIRTVLTNIFGKLTGISFAQMVTNSDLEINHTLGYTNPFLYLKVNNENFINEKGEAMSCRDVLDCIFKPLGLSMYFLGINMFFIDPLNLRNTAAGKKYDVYGSTLRTGTLFSIGSTLDLTTHKDYIKLYKTGQQLDIIQPYNQVKVKYDPYTFTEHSYNFNDTGNANNPNTYQNITNNGVNYYVYSGITMSGWTLSGGATFSGIKQITPDASEIEYYIERTSTGSGTYTYVVPFSNVNQDNNIKLLLSMEVYTNTKHATNTFNPAEVGTSKATMNMTGINVKVGDYYWNTSSQKWQTTKPTTNTMLVRQLDAEIIPGYTIHGTWFRKSRYVMPEDTSIINDTWITAQMYINISSGSAVNIGGLIQGGITVMIDKQATLPSGVLNLRVKDIQIEVVKSDRSTIPNDTIEFTGTIYDSSNTMVKSTSNITLKNGIGAWGASKGAFSSDNAPTTAGINISGLARGSSSYYNLGDLLCQTYISQYKEPRIKLTSNFNVWNLLYQTRNCLISNETYLPNKYFYIVSGTYYDQTENMTVDMVEIGTSREAFN